MRLTRVYRFAASHRLHASQLDEGQNRELYGKCNNPWGHGHDYILHVTVEGEPDRETGRILSPAALDRFVQDRVITLYDHRHLNSDVPGFHGVPTTENLALDVARRLQEQWSEHFGSVHLHRVFVQETPRNTFEVRTR